MLIGAAPVTRDDLVPLQLAIARRADCLARVVISDPATDVALWLQAEEEILARNSTQRRKDAETRDGQDERVA